MWHQYLVLTWRYRLLGELVLVSATTIVNDESDRPLDSIAVCIATEKAAGGEHILPFKSRSQTLCYTWIATGKVN